jgi:hypothetical protein
MKKLQTSILILVGALPLLANAELAGVQSLLTSFGVLVRSAIPIVGGLALLFFFWGLAQFILKSGDAAAQKEGRDRMIWGVIALFVLLSVWGLVNFIQRNLNIFNTGPQPIPTTLPGGGSGSGTGGTLP